MSNNFSLKTSCLLLVILLCTLSSPAQQYIYQVQQRADSLSIPRGEEAIKICDSMLANKRLLPANQGIFYRIKGKAYYFMGDYKNAGISYDQSVKLLANALSNTELGITFIEQAKLYRKLKMFTQAIEAYQKAKSIFEKTGDQNNLATVLNEWGVVYEMTENYPKAIDFYKQSLQIKETLKDTLGIAYANSFLADAYLLMDKIASAEVYAKKALILFQKINNPFQIASQSADMAALYEQKKDYKEAIRLLKYSNDIAGEMNYPDLLSQNYLRLAGVYTKTSDFKTAYLYYGQYATLKDSLFTESSHKTIAGLNIQYQTSEKDKRILEQQGRLLQQRWLLLLAVILFCTAGFIAFFIHRNRKLRETQIISEAKHKEEMLRMEAENNLQQDRLRISRDLHDNIGSYLTFINSTINGDNPEMELLKQATGESISELRRTVWLINRSSVGIEEWIVKLREYHLKIKNVFIESPIHDLSVMLTALQATGLFRIVQEAVNNALKYAEAQRIHIRVSDDADKIYIDIRDNGKGFDITSTQKGFGLENMKQRAVELKGQCTIQSSKGEGTCVSVQAPVNIHKNT